MPRILLFPVGKDPEVVTIPAGLKPMQDIVGGYIEQLTLAQGVGLIFNEEGRLMGLPANRFVKELHDAIRGPMFISRYDKEGNTVDITDEDVKMYSNKFMAIPL